MSDEYTIDAKYKRDSLVAEHERYRSALWAIVDAVGMSLPNHQVEALEEAAGLLDDIRSVAREALDGS